MYSDKRNQLQQKEALVQCKLHLMKHAWTWYSGPDNFSFIIVFIVHDQ